jgi:uncharacterized protein YjbJ (UPF0337 family)
MGAEEKTADKVKEIRGRIKKALGRAVGNPRLEGEGRAEQAQGGLKQAGEKIKDAFRK